MALHNQYVDHATRQLRRNAVVVAVDGGLGNLLIRVLEMHLVVVPI
jgi:predicted methyltransferase MtxX (methanogen marker protein 4)